MKIVKHLRQDAARLVGIGVAVGLSACSTLEPPQMGALAQRDATASTSPLSPSISASDAPAPPPSQPLTAEIDHADAAPASAPAPATPAPTPPVLAEQADQAAATPAVELTPAPEVSPTPASPRQDLSGQVAPATPAPWDPAVQVTPLPTVELTPAPAEPSMHASLTRDLPGLVSDAVPASPQDGAIAFESPLPGYSVNSHFGLRQLSFEPRARMHDGVDIAAPKGSAIHAAAGGYVVRSGLSSSYGHFVEVAHADGLTSFYAHMSRTAGLERGTKVSAGEVLGYVGSTGHSTGPHLHFEIRDDGKPLNPQDFIGRVFASAADLPLVEAQATAAISARATEVVSHWRQRMLASWHVRRHSRSASFVINHRVRARFAAG